MIQTLYDVRSVLTDGCHVFFFWMLFCEKSPWAFAALVLMFDWVCLCMIQLHKRRHGVMDHVLQPLRRFAFSTRWCYDLLIVRLGRPTCLCQNGSQTTCTEETFTRREMSKGVLIVTKAIVWICKFGGVICIEAVSYTHLTLPRS